MPLTPNTTATPATGPTSTSWWLTISAMLMALLPTLYTQITHQVASNQQIAMIVTGIGAVVSLGMKLYHDLQRHKWAAAASDAGAGLQSVLDAASGAKAPSIPG